MRRGGELIREGQERGEIAKRGRPKKMYHDGTLFLEDCGLTRHDSENWQNVAEVPEDEFEKYIEERNRQILRLSRLGWTTRQIAEQMGLTHVRVSQICKEIQELVKLSKTDLKKGFRPEDVAELGKGSAWIELRIGALLGEAEHGGDRKSKDRRNQVPRAVLETIPKNRRQEFRRMAHPKAHHQVVAKAKRNTSDGQGAGSVAASSVNDQTRRDAKPGTLSEQSGEHFRRIEQSS